MPPLSSRCSRCLASLLVPLLPGCMTPLGGPGGESTLRPVAASSEDTSDGDSSMATPVSAVTGWADRQRFIFARAWKEMRQDLEYDTIDSFGNLDGEARRDVLAMRADLVADRGNVDTASRRRRPREE